MARRLRCNLPGRGPASNQSSFSSKYRGRVGDERGYSRGFLNVPGPQTRKPVDVPSNVTRTWTQSTGWFSIILRLVYNSVFASPPLDWNPMGLLIHRCPGWRGTVGHGLPCMLSLITIVSTAVADFAGKRFATLKRRKIVHLVSVYSGTLIIVGKPGGKFPQRSRLDVV